MTIPLAALIAALSLSLPPCSPPVPQSPWGNFILPGVLGDVAYAPGLRMDAYAPRGEPRPAAIIFHGRQGSQRTHVTQLLEVLDKAGYAWFSIDYSQPEDAAAALRYTRCPGRFNITKEIILVGEDTGAEIALSLARRADVRGVVTFGARLPLNREAAGAQGQAAPEMDGSNAKSEDRSSPAPDPKSKIQNQKFPTPVLMFHGTADDEAPPAQAEAFCRKLANCRFVPVPGGIHSFENWHPDQWFWKEELTAWLRHDRRGLWKDLAYARPGGRELLMDAWLPEGPGPFPAVLIVHGGGWEAGDKVTYVSPVFEPLAKAGFAWFSIDYRLTPYVRLPDQLDDLRAAIRAVREHHDWFHVDPDRLALLGESASGQLVTALASLPCPGCEPQAVVSFYGVYDFSSRTSDPEWRQRLKQLFGDWTPETLREYSPIFHVRPDLPPLLLFQGTEDELRQGSLDYAARLDQAGARSELIILDGAPHGMENWEGHPEWMSYKQKLVEWLGEKLKAEVGNRK